jgi:hypothetical protein
MLTDQSDAAWLKQTKTQSFDLNGDRYRALSGLPTALCPSVNKNLDVKTKAKQLTRYSKIVQEHVGFVKVTLMIHALFTQVQTVLLVLTLFLK